MAAPPAGLVVILLCLAALAMVYAVVERPYDGYRDVHHGHRFPPRWFSFFIPDHYNWRLPPATTTSSFDHINIDYRKYGVLQAKDVVTPIGSINEDKGLVTIKARVTNRSSIRKWENENGSGVRVFFEVLDNTGEIRCISFGPKAEELFEKMKIDGVYIITNMRAKWVNETNMVKYRIPIKHDFELHATDDSMIDDCDDESLPYRTYQFVKINQLRGMVVPNDVRVLDVIGVCVRVDEMRLAGRSGHTVRDLYLVDDSTGLDSSEGITLTLWGEQAIELQQPDVTKGAKPFVVVAKRARLSDYMGGILNSGDTNMIRINPNLTETDKLMNWWFDNASYGTE